jgi:ABC-type proline/glycine betaine transport system substrate-binding protein
MLAGAVYAIACFTLLAWELARSLARAPRVRRGRAPRGAAERWLRATWERWRGWAAEVAAADAGM